MIWYFLYWLLFSIAGWVIVSIRMIGYFLRWFFVAPPPPESQVSEGWILENTYTKDGY